MLVVCMCLIKQKCTITPLGYCTTIEWYDYTLDYRRNSSASAPHYFPSTNTTYCEEDDAVCAECRASTFLVSADGSVDTTNFCVGANSCVCVAFCESAQWASTIVGETCNITEATDATTFHLPSLGIVALAMIACILICTGSLQLWLRFISRGEFMTIS